MATPSSVLGIMLKDQIFTATQLTNFRVYMAILPLLSFIFMAMTLFPSVDKGKPAALIGITSQLVFYVPVMLLVPRWLGVTRIYYGSFAIDAVVVAWTMLMVRKEFQLLSSRNVLQIDRK